jgi:hypothetical protein
MRTRRESEVGEKDELRIEERFATRLPKRVNHLKQKIGRLNQL